LVRNLYDHVGALTRLLKHLHFALLQWCLWQTF
jgi:hypothetical protein